MSNIYLKVAIETFSKLRIPGFEKFVTRSVFAELQLTQISLSFKTSCYNLKSMVRVVFYLNVKCINKISEYTYFYISKNITSYTFVACF